MTKLIEGIYHRKTASKELESTSGEIISLGETYFINSEANSVLTLNEGEVELLGLRDVSTAERKALAKKGQALADGSYPIASCKDASNAIRRIGTGTKHSKATIVAHIRKRVRALGCSGSIFENYK